MQFPARYEWPCLLVQLASQHGVTTREQLGNCLGESHAGICFDARHESLAGQARKLAFLLLAPALDEEHIHRCRPSVCAEQLRDNGEQCAFAVGAGPVMDPQRVLGNVC